MRGGKHSKYEWADARFGPLGRLLSHYHKENALNGKNIWRLLWTGYHICSVSMRFFSSHFSTARWYSWDFFFSFSCHTLDAVAGTDIKLIRKFQSLNFRFGSPVITLPCSRACFHNRSPRQSISSLDLKLSFKGLLARIFNRKCI